MSKGQGHDTRNARLFQGKDDEEEDEDEDEGDNDKRIVFHSPLCVWRN